MARKPKKPSEDAPDLPMDDLAGPDIGWKPGAIIDRDGVYPSIPLDEYHKQICAGFSTSHSAIEALIGNQRKAGSPKHFWDRCELNDDHEPRETTEAMTLGRAAHHLFLGEREFQKHYIRRPSMAPDGRNWNGNNLFCREWLEKAAAKGLEVLTPEMIEKIARMKVSLDAEPMIQSGLLGGRIEQSFIWKDRETGIWLKARPDADPTDGGGDYADLKIVADISEDGIQRSIASFGYHRQAALVCEGASVLHGYPLKFRGPGEGEGLSFSLVFVESKRPHAVEIVTLRPSDLIRGLQENRAALRLLKRCLDLNHWPGPSGEQRDARYLGLKTWDADWNDYRRKQIESQLAATSRPEPEGLA